MSSMPGERLRQWRAATRAAYWGYQLEGLSPEQAEVIRPQVIGFFSDDYEGRTLLRGALRLLIAGEDASKFLQALRDHGAILEGRLFLANDVEAGE